MTTTSEIARIETGVRNLDALLLGGVPKGSIMVFAGSPGAGKTILAQQICFHHATVDRRALYFSTLSEPTAKTLRYLSAFTFFDPTKIDSGIEFVDLGVILRTKGLAEASALIMEHVKKIKPSIVVIDSFKVFDDLAKSTEDLRKFGYELAVSLMAWEATTFLLGEYGSDDVQTNPLFSIVDGLALITQREQSGEQQRFLQILKMRGTDHSRDEHPFRITANGIEVFAPRVTIKREDAGPETERCRTGISKLDALLGQGISRGSSLLIAGVAGTGKTVLGLEFLYRGVEQNEKGIIFSFEETPERLRAAARGLGWDFDRQIELGMVEIVFIPQPNIMVEADLLMMRERIEAIGARRVVVDSVSVFLHKIEDPQSDREKIFQLATIIQNTQAVGFFSTDIPYGANQLSRFGVEETVVDGVILLSSTEEGLSRRRYLEVYKLRNTAHLKGRHPMMIGAGGIEIFPRYDEVDPLEPPVPLEPALRLSSGVPALDALMGGGLLDRSITVVSGSPGIGKTTLGIQFILDGARHHEPGLYVALDEGAAQLERSAAALGLPLEEATQAGLVEVLYLSREHVRAQQFLAILGDRIRASKIRRLVIDNAGHVMADELRPLLDALVKRFKALGVTSMISLEAAMMHSTETITDQGLSGIADNIILLRYAPPPGELTPRLTVVKTRGSAHDRRAHEFRIDKGGIHISQAAR